MTRLYNGLVLVLCPFCLYMAYSLTVIASHATVALILESVACAVFASYLAWLRFARAGRNEVKRLFKADWVGGVALTALLVSVSTAGFAAVSVVLYRHGFGNAKGVSRHAPDLVRVAFVSYLWHLADAIPLLKIPSTVNWKLSRPFTDSTQGGLTLGYTVVVIFPVLYAIAEAGRAIFSYQTKAEQRNSKRWRSIT